MVSLFSVNFLHQKRAQDFRLFQLENKYKSINMYEVFTRNHTLNKVLENSTDLKMFDKNQENISNETTELEESLEETLASLEILGDTGNVGFMVLARSVLLNCVN